MTLLRCRLNVLMVWLCVALAMPMAAYAIDPKDISHFIELEWEAITGASRYEVELTRIEKDGDRQKPIEHKTTKTSWRPKVIPGKYELRIRAFDERGAPGGWSDPSLLQVALPTPVAEYPQPGSRITAKDEEEQEVPFRWKPVAGAESYEIEVKSETGNFNDRWTSGENKKTVSLPVGRKYMYRMRAISDADNASPLPDSWTTFTLLGPRLKPPQPIRPLSKIIEKLQWKKSNKAESYAYDLLRKTKGSKWVYVKKNEEASANEVPFDMANPSGTYMLRVAAKAKNRGTSKKSNLAFVARGGFRNPAAVKEALLQESMRKPTNFYGIGSYFITMANYEGLNKERSGQKASFDGLTGTGRIGLGYQHPDYIWGVFGIADVGGILVNGQNNTFASAEGHGTVKFFLWGANQFVFSGGPYMIQLPEIVGNDIEGLKSFDKITNIGLHGGFKYWRPITEKYGLQANARLYLPVTGSSPTGKPIKSLMSYQFGVLGSYRWSENILALAGYAYRLNQAGYEAQTFDEIGDGFADAGDVNQIRMQGHYLNLILEYSF